MPMIPPSRSARAPPELPGEIAASVWIRSVKALRSAEPPPVSSGGNSRPTPLTTPEVTVDSKPDGLPIATASWPTTGCFFLVERGGRQVVAVHLHHGDLGVRIGADYAARLRGAVGEGHVHAGGPLDDVVVGDDVTVLAVDHTAPNPLAPLGPERRLSAPP